jgi:hypothetical protein
MLKPSFFAIFSIALSSLYNCAQAQNVYKCGDVYSQAPCPGARLLQVDDARDAAQKKQTDAAIRSDEKIGQAMEKERLAQEKLAPPVLQPLAPAAKAAPDTAPQATTTLTPKRIRSSAKKPKEFIAQVPGTEKKVVRKKASKKKDSTSITQGTKP